MPENNTNEKVPKFLTKEIGGLASLGLAGVSRFVFSGQINVLLGGSYNRSISEHGLESMGLTMMGLAAYQILETAIQDEKRIKDKSLNLVFEKILIVYYVGYLLLLVFNEVKQSTAFNRPFQWEQLVGSLTGIGLGWLAVALVNMFFDRFAIGSQDREV